MVGLNRGTYTCVLCTHSTLVTEIEYLHLTMRLELADAVGPTPLLPIQVYMPASNLSTGLIISRLSVKIKSMETLKVLVTATEVMFSPSNCQYTVTAGIPVAVQVSTASKPS